MEFFRNVYSLSRKIYIFFNLVTAAMKEYDHDQIPSSCGNDIVSYDFIIVGGGTAGCVVAGRLSEKYSVLLVEAGGYPADVLDIPVLADFFIKNYTKVYKSVPQNGLGKHNAQVDYLIGNVLGGGSSVNGMYNRGSPDDYDNWAKITGDSSWEYKNLLKYFRRIEDYRGSYPSDYNHGTGGPIPISTSKNYTPGLEEWMAAGEYVGLDVWLDPNGPQLPGFAVVESTTRKGVRVSAFDGYVKPFLTTRPNLQIVTQAEVKNILFNRREDRAVGVTFTQTCDDDTIVTRKVEAKKEVIISAGVMNSPAVLFRSGIGPADVLKYSNIPVVKILPVGYNLHDHVAVKLDFVIDDDSDVLSRKETCHQRLGKFSRDMGMDLIPAN